jgi:hypothetical protein
VVPVGHWHTPLTHTRPSGQQVLLVPVPQTRASGQHVPLTQVAPVWQHWVPQTCAFGQHVSLTQVAPVWQHWVPQGVVPDGQGTHWPLTQLRLQHSLSALQDTLFEVQHTPATHSCPSGQQLALVPVPHTWLVAQQLPLRQVSSEVQPTQVPVLESHLRHWLLSQGAARQVEPHTLAVAQQLPFRQVSFEVQPTQVPVLESHLRHWLLSQGQLAPL